jgi:hypothetical protein
VANGDEITGWEDLWDDVLVSDLPEPALLARYVRTPNELTPEESRTIDFALARSAAFRDEVDTLRGFDFGRLTAQPETQPGLNEVVRGWSAVRRVLFRPVSLGMLGAVAALVLWLAVEPGQRPGSSMPGLEEVTVAETSGPRGAEEAARQGAVEPGFEEEQPAAEESASSRLAAVEPIVEPRAAAPDDGDRAATPEAESAPAMPADEGIEAAPQILLAMNTPVYRRPENAIDHVFDMGAYRSAGAPPAVLGLAALVPDHTARAASASPRIFWSLDVLPEGGDFYVGIVTADLEAEVLLDDYLLAAPTKPGIQVVDLDVLGVELDAGREYRWSISHRMTEWDVPSEFSFGWMMHVPFGASEAQRLERAERGERPALLADSGYWYDALGETLDLVSEYPLSPEPQEAARALLNQIGRRLDLD